jgi:hypothetical protein
VRRSYVEAEERRKNEGVEVRRRRLARRLGRDLDVFNVHLAVQSKSIFHDLIDLRSSDRKVN